MAALGGHSRRVVVGCAAALFALALGLRLHRAATAPLFTADGAYYYAVAERLYAGKGFTIPYVWNYLDGIPRSLPVPSNRYWMPLTSVLEAGAFAIAGGASPLAGQMPSVLLGALLASFTFALTWALFHRLDAAVLAGLFWAVSPQLVSIAASTDCFMAAAAFGGAALFAIWRAWRGPWNWAVLAGAAAGLAYLTRSDAVLLAVVMALLLARPLARGERQAWRQIGLFAGAFALVAAPWWIRNAAALGHPFGTGALRTAWLVTYNDIFRADASTLTPQRYFASSQVVAAGFKAFVLYKELRVLAAIGGVSTALALVFILRDRERGRFAPWLAHMALVMGVSALVFPYPTIKGGFWHVAAALSPFLFAMGAGGLVSLCQMGRSARQRWAAWGIAGLAVAYFPAAQLASLRGSSRDDGSYGATAEALARAAPGKGPVLTDNCWRLYQSARRPCAQFPTDGAGGALRVADALGAQYAVVQAHSLRAIPAIGRALGTARFTRTAVLRGVYVYRITDGAEADARAKALNQKAIAAAMAGDLPAAISDWEQADSLKPDFAPILANLALAHWRAGRTAEAYLYAEHALRVQPSNAIATKVLLAAQGAG